MRLFSAWTALFVALSGLNLSAATIDEWSGYVAVEGSGFFHDALFPGQNRNSASVAFEPEYYREWADSSSFIFVPFARLDTADSKRTHFDIRELNYLWPTDEYELRVGIGKVFWGVTEFVHLVDIINQTDLVENINEEEKLGQPMVHLSIPRDWGVWDFFALPYFRERTFPGRSGRLRSGMVVDTDHPMYDSDDKQRHLDFAARFSRTVGDWDFGIYHFMGTGREPTMLASTDSNGRAVFIPLYEQINQTGLDVQMVAGQWLWKLESLYRTGQGSAFFAGIGGFEYTFVGVAETEMDLGVIGEYAYDDRRESATTIYENDLMVGMRLEMNDAASSQLLAGLIQDMDSPARAMSLEASRRVGSSTRISLEFWGFLNSPENDALTSLRDDDYLKLQLAHYF